MLKQISAKNLGTLALPDSCERCFWLKAQLGFRTPWGFFPGIFSTIDSSTKRISNLYHRLHDRVPPWLNGLGELGMPLDVPHHSRFRTIHTDTGIVVTGMPDEMFRRSDDTLVILDNKTARFTPAQDELLPLYRVQLSGYSLIAERIGMGRTSLAGLVYYEPRSEVQAPDLRRLLLPGEGGVPAGFNMELRAHVLPVQLDTAEVEMLLRRASEICERSSPPAGRMRCKDCQMLETIAGALQAPP